MYWLQDNTHMHMCTHTPTCKHTHRVQQQNKSEFRTRDIKLGVTQSAYDVYVGDLGFRQQQRHDPPNTLNPLTYEATAA